VNTAEVEQLLDALVVHVRKWLKQTDNVEQVTTSPTPAEIRIRSRLSPPMEAEGIEGVLEGMDDFLRFSIRSDNKRFMNPLWGGFNASAFAGEVLSALAQTSMYTFELAPFATMVEQAMVKRMCEIVGFPDGDGVLTTGGSNGNLVGMLCARHASQPLSVHSGFDGRNSAIFVSTESHYSASMAANVLGVGLSNIIKVACDDEGRMRPDALEEEIGIAKRAGQVPFCIIATSGTTVRGAFDPLREISEIAHRNEIWLHVDAAWGGASLFSAEYASLMDGVSQADSVCWDAHKMMGIPLICSVFLIKDPNVLRGVCTHTDVAHYLLHRESEGLDLGRISLQCGRRNDALKLWLAWREIGDAGWARRVEKFVALADELEAMVNEHPEMEMMSSRVWANVCFRMAPEAVPPEELDDFNAKLRKMILQRGRYMISKSMLDGNVILRPVIANDGVDSESLAGLLVECEQCAFELLEGETLIG